MLVPLFETVSANPDTREKLDVMANTAYLIQHTFFLSPVVTDYPKNPNAPPPGKPGYDEASLQFTFVTQAQASYEGVPELDIPSEGLEFAVKAAQRVARLVKNVPVLSMPTMGQLALAHDDYDSIQESQRLADGRLVPITIRDYGEQVADKKIILPDARGVASIDPAILTTNVPEISHFRYAFKLPLPEDLDRYVKA